MTSIHAIAGGRYQLNERQTAIACRLGRDTRIVVWDDRAAVTTSELPLADQKWLLSREGVHLEYRGWPAFTASFPLWMLDTIALRLQAVTVPTSARKRA